MKLTCIGKYGPYPKAGESCSCYLLTHNGKNIVIDMGSGALSQLQKILPIKDIDALLLSHLHADHMGDALTLRYALDVDKRLGRRSDPLPVYLPAEPTAEAGLLAAHGMVSAHFLSDGMHVRLFDMDVVFSQMPHPVPSFAMAFEADGKKFVYSGDTRDNTHIINFAAGADLLLMEAALLSKDKTPMAAHVDAKDAGRIAKDAGVRRLLVTHLFPEYSPEEVLCEVRESYPAAEMIEERHPYEV
jgi:ribonuclease BN (tRNA processing enzyme)